MNINKFLLGSVVILLLLMAYLVGKTQHGQDEQQVESAKTEQTVSIPTPEPTLTPTPTPTLVSKPAKQIDNTQLRKECVDKAEMERISVTEQFLEEYRNNEELRKYDFQDSLNQIEGIFKEKKEECYKIYK